MNYNERKYINNLSPMEAYRYGGKKWKSSFVTIGVTALFLCIALFILSARCGL